MEDEEKNAIEKPARLSIKLHPKLHREIKLRALNRNITITRWVLRAISEAIRKEKLYE